MENSKREIKFRAWDTNPLNENRMSPTTWTPQELMAAALRTNCALGNDILFLQFTGLKDKNGVEIYEGDIVERLNIDYLVEWNEKKGRYNIYNPKLSHPSYWGLTASDLKRCKVIGNIYQNPELLK